MVSLFPPTANLECLLPSGWVYRDLESRGLHVFLFVCLWETPKWQQLLLVFSLEPEKGDPKKGEPPTSNSKRTLLGAGSGRIGAWVAIRWRASRRVPMPAPPRRRWTDTSRPGPLFAQPFNQRSFRSGLKTNLGLPVVNGLFAGFQLNFTSLLNGDPCDVWTSAFGAQELQATTYSGQTKAWDMARRAKDVAFPSPSR